MQQYRIEPGEIESVRVRVTPEALARLPLPTPQDSWQARFCLSYIMAVTLLHGPPLIDFFSDAAIQDAGVRQMMDRVTVEATETSTQLIPHPSSITITLKEGRQLQHRVEFARGQPELPLDQEELDAKFLYCTRYILPPDHIEEAIFSFRNLEDVDNITGMASVLGG
jgi:2-methylcitrate dehydratase PrpD